MLSEPENPRFAYWLAAALAVALIAGWFVLNRATPPPAPAAATPSTSPTPMTSTATLKEAEQYFEQWGGYLIWENDLAEFAMWSAADRDYTQFFEVRHVNGSFAFRRLAKLTRPLIDHGTNVQCPLAFTETEAMRAAFYRQNPNFTPTRSSWGTNPAAPAALPPKPPKRFRAAATTSDPGTAQSPGPTPSAPAPVASHADGLARGSALLVTFNHALVRSGLPSAAHVTKDLLALFQVNPVNAVPANASASAISAAIAERKRANESMLAMSTALLSPKQLAVFRAQLDAEMQSLETRRPIP